jgi:hypothetical protein
MRAIVELKAAPNALRSCINDRHQRGRVMDSQDTADHYRSRAQFYRDLADRSSSPKMAEQRRELAIIFDRKAEGVGEGSNSSGFDRSLPRNLATLNPQLIAAETSDPRHTGHNFSARFEVSRGTKHLSSHDLTAFVEEGTFVGGHGEDPPNKFASTTGSPRPWFRADDGVSPVLPLAPVAERDGRSRQIGKRSAAHADH